MPNPICSTVRSATKTVRIDCDPQVAFEFLADLGNWPRWAVVNVKSTRRTDDADWWDMVTPHGTARLRIRADARHGILDHDFVDPQASWTVPARVVRNGGGTEFMITFFKPPSFTDAFFDEQIGLVDIELAKLKELLEAVPAAVRLEQPHQPADTLPEVIARRDGASVLPSLHHR